MHRSRHLSATEIKSPQHGNVKQPFSSQTSSSPNSGTQVGGGVPTGYNWLRAQLFVRRQYSVDGLECTRGCLPKFGRRVTSLVALEHRDAVGDGTDEISIEADELRVASVIWWGSNCNGCIYERRIEFDKETTVLESRRSVGEEWLQGKV